MKRLVHILIALAIYFSLILIGTYGLDMYRVKKNTDTSHQHWYDQSPLKQPYVHWKSLKIKIGRDTLTTIEEPEKERRLYYIKNTVKIDSIYYYTVKKREERLN